MKIFIVILHFGDSSVTNRCIKSIIDSGEEYKEIIVVDNANQFKVQSSKFKVNNISVIRNQENLGYAGGMNVGIKCALSKNANYVLLLNNDVILEEEILSKLVKLLETKKDVGIAGPAIKFKRDGGLIYDIGGKVNMLFGRTSHKEVRIIENKTSYPVDYVSGCCMLIKKEVFYKIGYFDELFFLYNEDVDFCLRARKESFKTYVVPESFIYHKLSHTVGKNSSFAIYHQTKSALLFGNKHLKFKFLNILFIYFQSIYLSIKNPNYFISVVKAISHSIFLY
ncbi:MAG: glycosyltransferase family 2 protein [Candidatus Levybacteria bacterium]|nr:glycosyltransferase family 2 protein [Candidatus Levybacteria bacterium]